jgi:hypothetical protein
MRNSIKALVMAAVFEAASLAAIGTGYAIGEWSYKMRRPDHFLIDLGDVVHLPGFFFAWLAGVEYSQHVAVWSIAIVGNLACWFLFWIIVYDGLAGLRSRWRLRFPGSQ